MPNRVRRIDLSVGERCSLRDLMKATRSKREYRKASAILEKADGLTYKAIAERRGVHKETAKRWVKAYVKYGLEGLRDKPHPGRPSGYTEAQRKRIVELALKSPSLFGYLKNDWSVRLLARHLSREVGVKISKSHVWRILHEADIVHKRPKATVRSPDSDYERKAEKVRGYKRIAPALEKRGP